MNNNVATLIECNLCRKIRNKVSKEDFGQLWSQSAGTEKLSLEAFVDAVLSGVAFSLGVFPGNKRKREDFIQSELIAVEFDKGNPGTSVEELSQHPFVKENAFLVYATASSTLQHPRSRAVFRLPEPITNSQDFEILLEALLHHFKDFLPDFNCDDAVRVFFGNDQAEHWCNLDNQLSQADIDLLLAARPQQSKKQQTSSFKMRPDRRVKNITDPLARKRMESWINRAVEENESDIHTAKKNSRNTTVFNCARRLFAIARESDGYLSDSDVEQIIQDAAPIAEDFPMEEVEQCIRQGRKYAQSYVVNMPDFTDHIRLSAQQQSQPPQKADVIWWDNGVPDAVRSLFLNFFPPSIAMIVEKLYIAFQQRELDPKGFTLAEAEATTGISRSTLRNIEYLLAVLLQEVDTASYLFEHTSFAKKGRPSTVYRTIAYQGEEMMLHVTPRIQEKVYGFGKIAKLTDAMIKDLDMTEAEQDNYRALQAVQDLDTEQEEKRIQWEANYWRQWLKSTHSTPLPKDWQFTNPSDYRAAYFRALVDAEQKPRSRRELSRILGVSNSGLAAVYKKAGIESEPQSTVVELDPKKNIQQQVTQTQKAKRGWVKQVIVELPDARKYIPIAQADKFVSQHSGQIESLTAQVQTASIHRPVTKEQPQIKPKQVRNKPTYQPAQLPATEPPQHYGQSHCPYWLQQQLLNMIVQHTDFEVYSSTQLINRETQYTLVFENNLDLLDILMGHQDSLSLSSAVA